MTPSDPASTATDNAARLELQSLRQQTATVQARAEHRERQRMQACATARLLLFAVFSVVAIRAVAERTSLAPVGLSALAFVAAVAIHTRVRDAHAWARRRRFLAEESLARLAGATGPGGAGTLPAQPCSALDAGLPVYRDEGRTDELDADTRQDLGVEGPAPSLWHLLDTTQTSLGARRLRRMLRHPLLDAADIRARQAAVAELARERAWRDELLAAFAVARGAPLARVPAFLAAPRLLEAGPLRGVALFCAAGLPASALAWITLPAARPVVLPAVLACAAVSLVLHGFLVRRALPLRDSYLEMEPLVKLASAVAPRVLAQAAGSVVLRELGQELSAWVSGRAGSRLATLRRALRFLHLHETGAMYPVLEMVTSWELNALFILEAGIKHHGATWERVAGALGELEALCALAVDADERGPGPWPEIVDGPPCLEIDSGVHPLLAARGAVPNDASLGGEARLLLVTGSNMAGKSTFLRMVALHVVLAQLGSPARARRVRLTPVRLRSLIHVRDSLADGKSYFLVEVERVRDLLQLTAREPRVLVVVDELFRGTNSVERVAASRAIARHWAATGALFVLATHDLDLARLADPERVPGTVAWHFPDEIVAGALRFPYRLQPGWSNTHNALRLLELSGYPETIVQAARAEAERRWAETGG